MSKQKRVLLFDIETSPNIGYTWGKYEQNVIKFIREGHMLSFAYKWLGDKRVRSVGLNQVTRFSSNHVDDTNLVKKLWELFNEADIIVAHYGDGFDIKKSNAFFAKAGLLPPSPYKTIDTKKEAKKYFKFNSNKLNDLGEYLHLGKKIETGGFELWEGCMHGDEKAWKKMLAYNRQDVVLLEKVYHKLKPWMKTHPDIINEVEKSDKCKNCGSPNIQYRGYSVTRKGKNKRVHCQECGAWGLSMIKEK